jgi:4-hydroxybenzoate polyprenyltransferase
MEAREGYEAGTPAPARPTAVPAGGLGDVVRLLRPRQWTKNLAVFAAVVFSGNLVQPLLLGKVALAFVAFDMVSSAFYAANDVVDAERDRQHPLKRERPVASGRITPSRALGISAALLVGGLAASALLGLPFLLSVATYCALQAAYAARLKNVPIVDMLVIAAGFVLRAVAGALVIGVPISPWLVLCTGLLALFLAAAKRRHERVLLGDAAEAHRPVLADYTPELLDSFLVTLSAATVTSYALYTFFEPHSASHAMMLTVPFVLYGVLRYQMLVLSGGGGRPEEVLLTDRPIITDIVLWIATAIALLYVLPLYVR